MKRADAMGGMEEAIKKMLVVRRDGTRLILSSPWLRENLQTLDRVLGVKPDSLSVRLTSEKRELYRGPLAPDATLRFDAARIKAGVYTFEILGEEAKRTRERLIWKQLLFVQSRTKRSASEIDELARRYAPVLVFSRQESYYPMGLGELLRHPTITSSDQKIKLKTTFGKESVPLPDLYDFLRYNGHAEYLLDQSFLSFKSSDFLSLTGDYRRAVVYYSYLEDRSSDRFFINYHNFYAFDPKTGVSKLLNVGPHIFDRESMTIVFRGDGSPEAIVLSGHLENQTILLLDRLKIWNTGRVRIDFPDPGTATVNGHPLAMVAQGSHAIYPCAGLFHISGLSELAGHVFRHLLPLKDNEDEPPEMSENQVLLPPSLTADRFASYELRPLRLDLLQSEPAEEKELYDPDTVCLVFSGYWVDVPGPTNARFPPFTRREIEVEDWTDNAYHWEWSDLPDGVVENNREIAQFIESVLDRS